MIDSSSVSAATIPKDRSCASEPHIGIRRHSHDCQPASCGYAARVEEVEEEQEKLVTN